MHPACVRVPQILHGKLVLGGLQCRPTREEDVVLQWWFVLGHHLDEPNSKGSLYVILSSQKVCGFKA